MAYLNLDTSVQQAKPVYLYKFSNNLGDFFYTSTDLAIVFEGDEYLPETIAHSEVQSSGDITKDSIGLDFPIANEMARALLVGDVDSPTTMTIFRKLDEFFVVFWKGRVSTASANSGTINLTCESVFTSMRRPGLRGRYQRTCRHNLYSVGCNVDPMDFAVSGSITNIAGLTFTIDEASAFASGYFVGGYLEYGLIRRFISSHYGNQISLIAPISNYEISLPIAVTLYPGCDKVRSTCKNKFDNLNNFGGFPWIPTKNPFSGTSIV